jgi:SWI/SNF-related matrix-associated actin-dependent regulator of chromatin subfamily A3
VKKDNPLRVLTYHAAGRTASKPVDFENYDVVITTYGTLATEYLPNHKSKPDPVPRKSGLFSVKWRRIVLDEGHIIRNPNTKSALAATNILARSRWVLTGTPIINTLKDLYSLVRFIGLTGGLESFEVFNSVLMRPIKEDRPDATLLLQALMGTLCLRRRKDMKFINLRLPELSEYVHRIKFLPQEKEKYDALEAQAKGLFTKFQKGGKKALETYRHVLETLLRMRQVCNHWQLCAERVTSLMDMLEEQKVVELTPENRKALQDMLQLSIESREDCPICLEDMMGHSPVITHCAHIFGKDCITRVIDTQHKCPMCRAELADESCLVQPAADFGEDADITIDFDTSSSKIEALLGILKASKTGTKTILFSQWTSFLDIVQKQLEQHGYKFTRIDGKMTAGKRDQALDSLSNDPDCTIMLASLGVCAVGLNLVAANQVILMDSWWAPAIEDQAIDRVHRLGQTKPTTVFRLVMEDSIEERTLEIQAEKRKLMMTAFQEKTNKRAEGKTARLADIQRLLS